MVTQKRRFVFATATATVVALLLLSGAGAIDATQVDEEDRSARYIGSGPPNHSTDPFEPLMLPCVHLGICLIPHPYTLMTMSVCDDEGIDPAGQIQGIGKVEFCAVVKESVVAIDLVDSLFEPVIAYVTCLYQTDEGDLVDRWITIAIGEALLDLPDWCHQHPDDELETTRVGVILASPPDGVGGTTGVVRLTII